MKKIIFCLLLVITSVQFVRAQSVSARQVNDSARIAGDWYLQPALPSDTATGRIPNISFDLSKKTFKGFTGCNQMNGSFSILFNTITFHTDLTLTKMACEGFNEKEFMTNLLRVNQYKITDGMLILMIDKTPISKWMRKSDKILTAP